ncbi:hypothetical protein [Gilvibacter sediminis]|uniref:hypothetical protein n=1 Tax=Gilvibacter sediminis TaxID=379071 RepID=UPI00235054E0|nr:hypothetical protein [Gilvibacter sediminis]MDC7999053.1 hypothetical protein [Gilvibacter sediminis]
MKLIKIMEIMGYGLFSIVMWWAGISTLMGKKMQSVIDSYGGAMTVFGIIALIIATVLSYITIQKIREYRKGDFT